MHASRPAVGRWDISCCGRPAMSLPFASVRPSVRCVIYERSSRLSHQPTLCDDANVTTSSLSLSLNVLELVRAETTWKLAKHAKSLDADSVGTHVARGWYDGRQCLCPAYAEHALKQLLWSMPVLALCALRSFDCSEREHVEHRQQFLSSRVCDGPHFDLQDASDCGSMRDAVPNGHVE